MKQPSVYSIVLNWNGAEDTIACVHSLLQCRYGAMSIVIVDNASTDDSAAVIGSAFPQLPLLKSPVNGGYAAGNNIGINYALQHGAAYVLIINNDATVEPDFLDHMVQYAEEHPDIGVLNARVYYPGTTEIFSAAGRFNPLLCTGQNKGAVRIAQNETEVIRIIDYACGVLMLVRAELFRTVGLLDERYFMYFEDLEFSRRVLKRYSMVYLPQAVAYHKSGGGKGWRNYTELYLYYHTRNRFLVFAEDAPVYKVYVAVFTTVNCFAKSLLLTINLFHGGRKGSRQLAALWSGWSDGIRIFLRKDHAA